MPMSIRFSAEVLTVEFSFVGINIPPTCVLAKLRFWATRVRHQPNWRA